MQDYCGTGCTKAYWVNGNGTQFQFGSNSTVGEYERFEFENVNNDTIKEFYAESFEGVIVEFRIWTDNFFAHDDHFVVDSFIEFNVLNNDAIDAPYKQVCKT